MRIHLILITIAFIIAGTQIVSADTSEFAVKPTPEQQGKYVQYTPSSATLKKLSEFGLPRYIKLSQPGKEYRGAVQEVVDAVDGKSQISEKYGIYRLKDTVTTDFAATVVDLAFVYEGYRLPAPEGIARAVEQGLTPLTMGQCADLFIATKLIQKLVKAKKFPMLQCPGTQFKGAISQIYFSDKKNKWVAGGLGRKHVGKSWPMAIYAGPHKCENCQF